MILICVTVVGMTSSRTRSAALFTPLALSAVLLAACSQNGSPSSQSSSAKPTGSASAAQAPSSSPMGSGTKDSSAPAGAEESEKARPRLLATYEGGLVTLDAETLKPIKEEKLGGFLRVNSAGDGRHAFVTTKEGFRLFDLGTWEKAHGDHSHYYTQAPKLTDLTVAAKEAGHVVTHAGKTALFADGTGTTTLLDTAKITEQAAAGMLMPVGVHKTPEAHHGVAVPLESGGLITTRSHGEKRVGMTAYGKDLTTEAVSSEDCPGTHGESATEGGAVLVGCENGALIYKDGKITKVTSPDAFGRIGNQAGSPVSPISLGDYKTNPTGGTREHPTRISLIDTRTSSLRLVDVKASYSFRSLGRGPAGEALVLGNDGALRVIDPESGKIVKEIPVTAAWTEPEEWQKPRPTLFVSGKYAYVTEPAAKKITKIDLATREIVASAQTPHALNELTGVSGKTEAGH